MRRVLCVAGVIGHGVECAGGWIELLGVEARMPVCSVPCDFGARVALMAASDKVIDYIAGCPRAPTPELLAAGRAEWQALRSDPAARFDREIALDAGDIPPMVSWGTSPDQSLAIKIGRAHV